MHISPYGESDYRSWKIGLNSLWRHTPYSWSGSTCEACEACDEAGIQQSDDGSTLEEHSYDENESQNAQAIYRTGKPNCFQKQPRSMRQRQVTCQRRKWSRTHVVGPTLPPAEQRELRTYREWPRLLASGSAISQLGSEQFLRWNNRVTVMAAYQS